jgi:hypothetical protein
MLKTAIRVQPGRTKSLIREPQIHSNKKVRLFSVLIKDKTMQNRRVK